MLNRIFNLSVKELLIFILLSILVSFTSYIIVFTHIAVFTLSTCIYLKRLTAKRIYYFIVITFFLCLGLLILFVVPILGERSGVSLNRLQNYATSGTDSWFDKYIYMWSYILYFIYCIFICIYLAWFNFYWGLYIKNNNYLYFCLFITGYFCTTMFVGYIRDNFIEMREYSFNPIVIVPTIAFYTFINKSIKNVYKL